MRSALSAARLASSSALASIRHHQSRRLTAARAYSTSSPDLIDELEQRGLVATLTSRSLRTHLSSAPRVVYSGVDPSADSLHVGNLLPLLTLAHFARYNHKPIVLVGGATGSIGDPSGRSTERNALDPKTLQRNVDAIGSQLERFFANVAEWYDHPTPAMGVQMMNNYAWTSQVTLLDFLGGVGRHARLTQMLARESVASRLSGASGMSYTEFSYQLLQAYDFAHLHAHNNCTVQLGGSDQLGNITAGIDLIRRQTSLDCPAYGLTLPLLTTASGEKFGKSAGNAVWLSADKTSDWEFYQFFLRTGDADVARYLRTLTLMELGEVESVVSGHKGEVKRRRAQAELATHVTRLIRGRAAADKCRSLSHALFSHTRAEHDPVQAAKHALASLDTTSTEHDGVITRLPRDQVVGADVTKLVVAARLVKSRAEARRLLASGGLYVNNRQVEAGGSVGEADLVGGKVLVRTGKASVKVVVVV